MRSSDMWILLFVLVIVPGALFLYFRSKREDVSPSNRLEFCRCCGTSRFSDGSTGIRTYTPPANAGDLETCRTVGHDWVSLD